MSRIAKSEFQERDKVVLMCVDCGEPADVHVQVRGFCAEHYRRRAVAMRRNADGLVLGERGAFVEPTENQRRQQSAVIKAYLGQKDRHERQKWENVSRTVGGLNPASTYASRSNNDG